MSQLWYKERETYRMHIEFVNTEVIRLERHAVKHLIRTKWNQSCRSTYCFKASYEILGLKTQNPKIISCRFLIKHEELTPAENSEKHFAEFKVLHFFF